MTSYIRPPGKWTEGILYWLGKFTGLKGSHSVISPLRLYLASLKYFSQFFIHHQMAFSPVDNIT